MTIDTSGIAIMPHSPGDRYADERACDGVVAQRRWTGGRKDRVRCVCFLPMNGWWRALLGVEDYVDGLFLFVEAR